VVARLPVVVPELAVLHVAGYPWATVDHVERAIYAARRQGWLTNASLQEYLYRRARRGRPGVRKTREALARSLVHARPTASDMETKLLQVLRAHGLPEPELQFELRDAKGVVIATVDAALTKWQILLEYDSREHHSDETDEDRDNRRREWAAQYGYWLIPVRYVDLQEGGHGLARAIRGAIARLEGRVPAPHVGA
jgi:very-short-patch-repair endonuclease